MTISAKQIRMARAALDWGIRDLARHAGISPDTVSRIEQGAPEINVKSLGAVQKALEEAYIEFLPNSDGVVHHNSMAQAAICADPSMPLGVRRIYPHDRPY